MLWCALCAPSLNAPSVVNLERFTLTRTQTTGKTVKTLCNVTLFFTDNTVSIKMMLDLQDPNIENIIYDTFGDIEGKELFDFEIVDIAKLQELNVKSNQNKGDIQ